MAKFKTSNNKFAIILSGKTIADNYYTSIRIEVKGCVTKQSDIMSWQDLAEDKSVYYGTSCYLPENKAARRFIKEYINGKTFKSKFKRSINAHYKWETSTIKELIFNDMIDKINHLIDNSFK